MWALLDIYSSGVFWLLLTIGGDRILQERQGAFALTPDRLRPSEWSLPMASPSETPHALPDTDVSALGRQSAAEDEGTHGSSQSDLGHGLTQHQQTMGQEPTVTRASASSA